MSQADFAEAYVFTRLCANYTIVLSSEISINQPKKLDACPTLNYHLWICLQLGYPPIRWALSQIYHFGGTNVPSKYDLMDTPHDSVAIQQTLSVTSSLFGSVWEAKTMRQTSSDGGSFSKSASRVWQPLTSLTSFGGHGDVAVKNPCLYNEELT